MKKLLSKNNREYVIAVCLAVILLLGLVVENKFYMGVLIDMVYACILASAWNLMCGFTGQISLGHAAFLGVGQYTCVLLFTKLGVTPWIGILLGGLAAGLLAFLVGALTLRLKGPFFSLSTIALATILQIFAVKFDWLTGGSSGMSVPYRPSLENLIFQSYKPYYLMFVVLLGLVLCLTTYISRSRLGSNLVAIRENDVAAASLGVKVFRSNVTTLMISAFLTGVAGCLYAQYTLFIDPVSSFNITVSTKAAIMSIFGGAGTVLGPIIGGLLLSPTETYLRTVIPSTYAGAYLIIYGVLLIFVILVVPDGIIGTYRHYKSKKTRPAGPPSGDADPTALTGAGNS